MDTVTLYYTLKMIHIISFVAWMAGMFYLPRLYVYHADAPIGGELSETLKVMERRLLRAIINPAMISTFVFGIWLIIEVYGDSLRQAGWLHAKLTLVLVMAGLHGFLARCRKQFAADTNAYSAKFYRVINEVPTVLLIAIVYLAVFKPF